MSPPVCRAGWVGVVALLCWSAGAGAVVRGQRSPVPQEVITEGSVRGHMELLASDAMNGRGSGTRDEWLAAAYVASQLTRWGIEPLGDAGGFLQTVDTERAGPNGPGHTWNVVGRLVGRDPKGAGEAILLSAHLDHLGARGTGSDVIYNGADDDASGVTAVLALAEALAKGQRPRRTVLFAFFGSEETGGVGSRYFVDHPPVPLDRIVANLQFEMIGRPDPSLPPGMLWLTGYERSSLGLELARQGAMIAADPHPKENFFFRSDNVQLAYRGVVAHTVSSFGLHRDYHTPADDLAGIDFRHMTAAIQTMLDPVLWLANGTFMPEWRTGMQPVRRQVNPPGGGR